MFAHDLSDRHSGLNNSLFELQSCNKYFTLPGGSIIKIDPKNDWAKRHPQIFNLQY